MSPFFRLLGSVKNYKTYTCLGILFHLLTAILTVVSIPLIIPFFQILFGISPSDYEPPQSIWELEEALNYGFSRLIAISDHFIALQVVCLVVIVIYFLKNVSRFLVSYFMIFVRNGILRDLRASIWQGFESLSLEQRNHMRQGYLMSLITNDLSEVDHGILKVFEMLFKTPLIIIGSLGFMIWLNLTLTLIAFALILFTLIIIGGISHILKSQSSKAQAALSVINVLVDQYLSATKLIRIHHAGGFFRQKFNDENESYFRLSNKILRRRDLASPLAEFLGVVTIVILLFCGTHEVFAGTMEPATFFAFIFAFYNIIDPAKSFSREFANIQKGMAALERIEDFKKNLVPADTSGLGILKPIFEDSIVFKGVSFGYKDNQTLLTDLNITVRRGDRIGIVGNSGVGKTTILDLLLGFYTPVTGNILLDGVEIKSFDEVAYRSMFGLVTQHPVLFHGTVRENIVLDRVEDEDRLYEVLRLVGLDQGFIEKKVGDQLAMISGGEAQRVSLARVLYRAPEFFLLDEPTSQLDTASVRDLVDTIMNITSGHTVIMITHQVKLLKDMNNIIVVDNGKIVDQGQYQSLSSRNDFFKELVDG